MKVLVFALVSMMATAAQGASFDVCFSNEGETAHIFSKEDRVFVNWKLNGRGNSESGFMSEIDETTKGLKFDVYLQGTGDGSNVRFVISDKVVKVQSLWGDGTPIDEKPSTHRIVDCPN